MKCPKCESTNISNNGQRRGKQNYICRCCHRQFVEFYDAKGYSDEIKQQCLKMYLNGMGFTGIEDVTGVHHTTVISWVKQIADPLPDAPEYNEIPEVAQLDELETFVGSKKTRFGARSAVNKGSAGILAWVLGDTSAETFKHL